MKINSLKICDLARTPIVDLYDNTKYRVRNVKENLSINEIIGLSFDLPIENPKWKNIKNEQLILFNDEYYKIKNPSFMHDEDGKLYIHVECKHYSDNLANDLISISETTPRNVEDLMKLALCYENNVPTKGWSVGNITVDRVALRGLEAMEQSPFSILLTIAEKYDGILKFNSQTMTVDMLERQTTEHPSIDLRVSKNLKSVQISYDTTEMFTRLYCYGAADDEGNELDIMSANPTGKPYIDNFDYFYQIGYTQEFVAQHPEIFVSTNIWRDDNYYDAQDLYEDGLKESAKVAQPKVDVKVTALDIETIGDDGNIVKLDIGDCIRVYDEDLEADFLCNIISREIDYENPHLLTFEVTNSVVYHDVLSKLFTNVNTVSSVVTSGGNIIGGVGTSMSDVQAYLNTYYLNTEQLDAKYATINELKANYITSEYLVSHYIDADSIGATYATITSLNAVEAKIQNLDVTAINAKFADIDKLLADQGEFLELIATDAEIEQLKTGDLSVYGLLSASNAEIETIKSTYLKTGDFEAYKATIENLFTTYASIEYLEANYIKAQQIESNYAKITALNAVVADIETLNTNLASIEELVAKKASIEDLNAANASITKLNTDLANVNTLLATKVDADYVEAEIVEATTVLADDISAINAIIENLDTKYATIEVLNAKVAELNTLISKKATIEDLNAAVADIGTLTAQVANINSIMSGNIGTGTLQTIRLTADNVVIDEAVIKQLIAANIDVNDLKAGTISTDKFTIKSDDGGVEIVGSTQQFYDDNGNVRLQMGKDAQGNFNFIVVGEDGTTTLFDHTGMKAAGVPDGLIVNKMVADNANISGSKLDINSVVDRLNADGTKTINSSKIWIDEENQSLGAKFDSITTNVTTAMTQSSSAVSTANTAKDTAETAKSTADSASKTASNASTVANTAKTTAENASSVANTAKNTADNANANASNALNQANTNKDDIATLTTEVSKKVNQTDFVVEQGKITSLISTTETLTTTVETLEGDIENAQSTADTAKTNANNAQTTANSAVSKANTLESSLTTLTNKYNQTVQTVESNTTNIGNIQTSVNNLTGEVNEMESSMLEIKETADGVSTIVTQNKATWDGAATKAETAQTTATQTANKLNWIVKSGTNETDFTLTDRTASLVAEQINLKGLVTFEGLNSETQDKINKGANIDIGGRNLVQGTSSEWKTVNVTQFANSVSTRYHCSDLGLSVGDTITFGIDLNPIEKTGLSARIDFYSESTGDSGKTTFKGNNILKVNGSGRSTVTATIPVGKEYIILFVQNFDPTNETTTTVEQYKCLKLEKGNIPTDWSPAPEDFEPTKETVNAWGQEDVTPSVTTINGGYIKTDSITSDSIDVNELFANVAVIDKITSYKIRAEQIDAGLINANMLDIYGLVVRQIDTNVETLAIDTKGDITMRGSIESYNYVGGKTGWSIKSNGDAEFNDVTVRGDLIGNFGGIMSVGGSGENLFSGFSYNQEIQLTDYQGVGSFTVSSQLSGHLTFDPATTVGKTYTISFYAKSPNGETPLQLYNRNSLPRYFYIPTTVIDTALSTEWKYYTYTFVNTDMGESYSTDPTYVNRIEIYAPNQLGVLVKNIKVEEGYVATPWSPAINDNHKEIVFWAGSGYDQREYAPYRVYSDGSVISTRGTFSGVWTGEIEIGNISIIDPSKTSGNDAILTIQHGGTGVKRIQLRDTETSTFAQNIAITDDFYNDKILLINDGTVNVTNQYIVGDTTITDKNVKLGDGYLKYLDTTLSVVASNVALGSSGDNIQADVYGNQTVHGNMTANKDILFANGWFIKQSSLGLDISVNES